jgi:signal transduction histidine kinase/CheY-like chemotaxis protein
MLHAGMSDVDDLFLDLPDPAILLDQAGAPLRANAAFQKAFKHRISPQRPPWGRVTPPPFDEDLRVFDAAAPDGRLYQWRERQFSDGKRLALARDITERARAEAETAKAKSLLFATLTHELRTPLNGILGMAQLLEALPLDAAHHEYLRAIQGSGEHLLDLVTEILDFSRLESGRVTLEDQPYEPELTMQAVAELLSPRAREKNLEVLVRLDPAAPRALSGDEGRMRQILFNLVGNAVKFTERGVVSIEYAPGAEAGTVRWTVRDTGPGIAADKQIEIFEAFTQADASHARRFGGAGLGLAIVRKLASAMGGRAGLSSKLGRGATFWVELPAVEARALSPPPPSLEGLAVAVRTDSPLLEDALVDMLQHLGARPIRLLPTQSPRAADVVLVDGDFGALSGDARCIRLAPQEERAKLGPVGEAAPYLLKPLRRTSLATRILAVAGRAAPPAPVRSDSEDERAAPAAQLSLEVLLAEDNPINALLARTLLARMGCRVEVVQDGEEAVEAARRKCFDLILLDLRMPRLDGCGAARRIRGLAGPSGRTPIVALTADAGDDERAAAFAAGMNDFVTKPISAERLARVAARFRTKAATVEEVEPGSPSRLEA